MNSLAPFSPIRKGDIIDIVAPASTCSFAALNKGVNQLHDLGFKTRLPSGICNEKLFNLKNDEQRFAALHRAIYAKDSKIIWCLRGGYGSHRMIPTLLKLTKTPPFKKLILGYSDITSLHIFFNDYWGWPTLHSSGVAEIGDADYSKRKLERIMAILTGKTKSLHFSNLKPMNCHANSNQSLNAMVGGGNLTLIMNSLATPWQAQAKGKIIVLEDVNERGYAVDRSLFQLFHGGYFNDVQAVIFGRFVGGAEKNRRLLWKKAQQRFADEVSFPVLKGLPFGHYPGQKPMPFLTQARLNLGEQATLTVQTG